MHVEIHFSTVRFLKIKNANYGYKYLHLPMNSCKIALLNISLYFY